MHATPRELTKLSFKEIITSSKYKNFIFDCDGVIYNGSSHMQEAYKALNSLKEEGKNVFLLTNSSTSSRREIHDKVKRNGFDIDIERVFTSSSLSAQYIKMTHPEIQKVYVIGGPGLVEELEAVGLTVYGHKNDDSKKLDGKSFDQMRVDEDIKAVVLGIDYEINFYKISYASALVQKGAILIASNADPCVRRDHYKMPAGGFVVKAVEHACQKEAHLVGKPNKDAIDIAQKKFGIKLEETLMIGDSLNSDIMLGKNAGIDTFLVLTGNTSEEQVKNEQNKERGIIPTYYGDAVSI